VNFSRKNVKGTADQVSASKRKLSLDTLPSQFASRPRCINSIKNNPHTPPHGSGGHRDVHGDGERPCAWDRRLVLRPGPVQPPLQSTPASGIRRKRFLVLIELHVHISSAAKSLVHHPVYFPEGFYTVDRQRRVGHASPPGLAAKSFPHSCLLCIFAVWRIPDDIHGAAWGRPHRARRRAGRC
jgi:hypothetical protein